MNKPKSKLTTPPAIRILKKSHCPKLSPKAKGSLKQALYDNRVSIPHHPKLQEELLALEFDTKKTKWTIPANLARISAMP